METPDPALHPRDGVRLARRTGRFGTIEIVERPDGARLYVQNQQRESSVPAEVIRKLTARWEVADLTEAHRVDWVEPTSDEPQGYFR